MADPTIISTSIRGSKAQVDGMRVRFEHAFSLEVGQVGPKEIGKALADSEQMAALLRDRPDEMAAIVNAVATGRLESAREQARAIGLTEAAFQEQGGGMLWWFMIGVAAGAIIVAAATTEP